jgi:hypothetical protein
MPPTAASLVAQRIRGFESPACKLLRRYLLVKKQILGLVVDQAAPSAAGGKVETKGDGASFRSGAPYQFNGQNLRHLIRSRETATKCPMSHATHKPLAVLSPFDHETLQY